ncbi:MAG: superoxide dismutase, Ni [Sphingomonadales bacterium]
MIFKLLTSLDRAGAIVHAKAHCDIPCGIYDPAPALISAVTIVRLMDIMHAASGDPVPLANLLARNAVRKEKEAEAEKHEVRVIWGDYFKGPLLEKYPNVHSLAHSIMLKASACKQDAHREDGLALVELVNEFAEMFWDSKGVATKRVTTPYAPNLEVVTTDL